MAELEAKPEEENPEQSENNVLLPGLGKESVIGLFEPTVSGPEQSFFSDDMLDFLDHECNKPNVPTVLDLSQDKVIDDRPNVVHFLDITEDTLTGVESHPGDRPDVIHDLTQTMEKHKESNHTETSSRKHKLHGISECEGSASKSVKISSPISSSHFNEHGGFTHLNFAGFHHVIKNHTVTSADVSWNKSNTLGPRNNRVRLETHLEPTPTNLPTYRELFPTKDPNVRTNSVNGNRPRTPLTDLGLCSNLAYPQTIDNSGLICEHFYNSTLAIPINTTTGLDDAHTSGYAHDSPLFYQLLEMFPDIEVNFLRNICNGKHDLNQVIDIILEMNNNYPKVGSSKQPVQTRPNLETYIITQRYLNMPQNFDKTPPLSYPETSLHSYSTPFLGNTAAIPINRTNEVCVGPEQNKLTESEDRPIVETFLSKCDHSETSEVPSDIPLPVNGIINCLDVPVTEQNDDMKKFDFLIKIFPDADPAFLQAKSKLGESELRKVVSEALENNNYPKIVTKEEKQDEDSDQSDLGLYTTSFRVEKFLQIFPEPFQYFFDEKRVCHSKQHCLEFMKRR